MVASSLEFVLLYFYGAGGEGKTTLLKHLAEICETPKTRKLIVDARETEAHPVAFLEAVRKSLGKSIHAGQDVFEALRACSGFYFWPPSDKFYFIRR